MKSRCRWPNDQAKVRPVHIGPPSTPWELMCHVPRGQPRGFPGGGGCTIGLGLIPLGGVSGEAPGSSQYILEGCFSISIGIQTKRENQVCCDSASIAFCVRGLVLPPPPHLKLNRLSHAEKTSNCFYDFIKIKGEGFS